MIRIGFDIGGSKIAAIALDQRGHELARLRRDVPRDYRTTLAALVGLCGELQGHGTAGSIGIGMPGLIGGDGALIRVVNLPWLEGRPLQSDLQAVVQCPVQIANDANCFALSEAIDGAAAGARVVFGATLGTGVGGAIVVEGRPLAGATPVGSPGGPKSWTRAAPGRSWWSVLGVRRARNGCVPGTKKASCRSDPTKSHDQPHADSTLIPEYHPMIENFPVTAPPCPPWWAGARISPREFPHPRADFQPSIGSLVPNFLPARRDM